MSVFRYPTYKIRIAPDSQKTQGLQAGDIIRRQYAERERTVYSLMCVTETGTELVGDKDAPYFIGALLDGDEPQGGELLDFVRITNLFDTARSGALYLTASDSDSPYMDVIDGMATERSLCYPVMDGGMAGVPDKSRYAVYGSMLQTEYLDADSEATRIVRIIRNAEPAGNASFGLMLTLEEPVGYPERLLVSFKVRSSKTSGSVPIRFGYTNREKTDAEDEISIGREWKYKLWVITVDYPAQYSRGQSYDDAFHVMSRVCRLFPVIVLSQVGIDVQSRLRNGPQVALLLEVAPDGVEQPAVRVVLERVERRAADLDIADARFVAGIALREADVVCAVAVQIVGGVEGRDVDAVPLLVEFLAQVPAHQVVVAASLEQQLDGALAADLQHLYIRLQYQPYT